jgi:two-component system sensor histidine kinase KdpD
MQVELGRRPMVIVLLPLAALAAATGLVWLLEGALGFGDASPAYLLAVTAVAVVAGVVPAIVTSAAAFLVYNFLFTHPRFTLIVSDSAQLLNLVLLLVVGVVVGQLAGAQRQRAQEAEQREREARVLFQVSRALATRADTPSALREIVEILRASTGLEGLWVATGTSFGTERRLTPAPDSAPDPQAGHASLQRRPGDEPARWMRVLPPGRGTPSRDPRQGLRRVPIQASGSTLGSLWALPRAGGGDPDEGETRMLAVASDQIGLALEQDRLRREANSAELARESEAMKSALLESVSHDLRTPLAAIRAAAGILLELRAADDGVREQALAIDADASDMNRLVGNLLEISRIEAGGLAVDLQPNTLDDLVETAVRRLRQVLAGRTVEIDVPPDLPFVMVDALQMDQVLANLLENAAVHAPEAPVRVSAGHRHDRVWLLVEDGGLGVPEEALPLIFRKFYRVRRPGGRSRRGTGVGLAVVKGLVESMGGTVSAAASPLGGLAVTVELAAAPPEPEPEPQPEPDGRALQGRESA